MILSLPWTFPLNFALIFAHSLKITIFFFSILGTFPEDKVEPEYGGQKILSCHIQSYRSNPSSSYVLKDYSEEIIIKYMLQFAGQESWQNALTTSPILKKSIAVLKPSDKI